jgi:putative copper resistance protein D
MTARRAAAALLIGLAALSACGGGSGQLQISVESLAATGSHPASTPAGVQPPGMSMVGGGEEHSHSPAGLASASHETSHPQLAPLTVGRAFTTWSLHPWSALTAGVLLVGYLVAAWFARRRRTWSAAATTAWCAGIVALVYATQGGLRVYDDSLFWLHMVGHLTLVMVVPILLVAGRPLNVAIAALPERRAEQLGRVLRGRACSLVTNPAVGLALYTAVIVGTHLTGFMNQRMLHPWLVGLEQLMYVGAGVLFFLPLVASPPIRWQLSAPLRMAMLVVAMPVDTFTGVILGETDKYPWPAMAAMHPTWAPNLVTDLHAGGAVMWIGGDAIMALMFGISAVVWARSAMSSPGSELGGWLDAVRANYQHDLVGADATTPPADVANPDSDEALESYNAYLRDLSSRRR